MVLPLDLYSMYGVKLLARRTKITKNLLERLSNIGHNFILAENAREVTQTKALQEVDPEQFKPGTTPPAEVVCLGGRIASETADHIESHHTDALSLGAFVQKKIEPNQIAAERRRLSDEVLLDCERRWETVGFDIPSVGSTFNLAIDSRCEWPAQDELTDWRDTRVELIRQQYAGMLAGLPADFSLFERLVDELIGLAARNHTRLPQIALLCPRAFDYIPDHAMSVSVLAIATAIRLGWPIESIRMAGLAALGHDTGMLLLPQRIRVQAEPLDDYDRSRVLKHTAYSVMLLHETTQVPEILRCVSYRHHERDNGFGYPHGIRAAKLDPLSRLLAVADTAAAMSEPRPFRNQPLPHEAVVNLLQYATDGYLYRPMVRALIESIGLYPIGSYVQLSTGELGQVITTHPEQIDRPAVEICDHTGHSTGQAIDLEYHEPWDISILKAINPPGTE